MILKKNNITIYTMEEINNLSLLYEKCLNKLMLGNFDTIKKKYGLPPIESIKYEIATPCTIYIFFYFRIIQIQSCKKNHINI
jgi:hypothetical protein